MTKHSTDDSEEYQNDVTDSPPRVSLVQKFDEICFSIGDCDAIELIDGESDSRTCYIELQEHSKALAAQLWNRYRPDYVLVDCQGWVAAEAVATLACMRLQIPFVPVSCYDQHRPGKLEHVVDLLRKQKQLHAPKSMVVAVTVCDNDRDPILSVFQQAGVHQILYLDGKTGSLNEQLNLPQQLPEIVSQKDDLYILFTSGTSGGSPKAVVGSHRATYHRIKWWLDHLSEEQAGGAGLGTDRMGRRSKLTFVDGVNELWTGLLGGGVLVTMPPQQLQQKGIACLYDKCAHLLLLPSQLHQMLLLPKSDTLRRVVVSGEVCSSSLIERFHDKYKKQCQLYNFYGQTESTGDICFAVLEPADDNTVVRGCVTIGKPILDTIQIKRQSVGDGSKQELILHGADQLGNGYLAGNGEDRQPFSSFATGDIGFCHNGQWYIQGRTNDVVKINGIWTSPTEIEAAFSRAYDVSQGMAVAVIVANKNDKGEQQQQQQHKSYILCSQSSIRQEFSRIEMQQIHRVPWNLIPNEVFAVKRIPQSTSGAKKINRRACKALVMDLLENQNNSKIPYMVPDSTTRPEAALLFLVSQILSIPIESLDSQKSFAELGGDSATSISLLYRIRQENLDNLVSTDLSVLDVLSADSLQDLWAMLTGAEPPTKRARVDSVAPIPLSKKTPRLVSHSKNHGSIALLACVDVTPLIVTEDNHAVIYAACQGGMIVKVHAETHEVLAHKWLHGWMIQADILHIEQLKSILVCAHNSEDQGRVLQLSLDLEIIHWEQTVSGPIKTAPVLVQDQLWVQAGSIILTFEVASGSQIEHTGIRLPHPCGTPPLVFQSAGSTFLAYASSDWETCLMIVGTYQKSVRVVLDYEIGPVHNAMTPIDDCDGTVAWIAGSYGIAYRVDLRGEQVERTLRPSGSPLSSMVRVPDTNRYIVGSCDGVLRCCCLDSKEKDDDSVVLWETPVGAAVCARPATLVNPKDDKGCAASSSTSSSVVAVTTAGDVVVYDARDGSIKWKHRIAAEIWSNPVYHPRSQTLIFGARDSCLHLIRLHI